MKQVPKVILLVLVLRLLTLTAAAQDESPPYIEENPDNVSVICVEGDETIVSHNAEVESSLASTGKTIFLAEYARQVAAGNLDPEEEIALSDLDAYYIPGTDGNAHVAWMSTLGEDAEFATLSQIADAMITYSSNAAADYILSRLDTEGFADLYETLGMENTDLPTYFLGNVLVLSNHETGVTDLEYVEAMDEETFFAEHDRLVELFVTDEEWRAAELEFRQGDNIGMPDFETQAAFFDTYGVQSTAEDMLKLIEAAYEGDALSADAKVVMQDHLGWLFAINPANASVFEALGTKGGAYAGIFTSVWYADAIEGDPVSLVVLYHDLPDDLWIEWLSSYAYQMLEVEVISTPAGCDVFADLLGE